MKSSTSSVKLSWLRCVTSICCILPALLTAAQHRTLREQHMRLQQQHQALARVTGRDVYTDTSSDTEDRFVPLAVTSPGLTPYCLNAVMVSLWTVWTTTALHLLESVDWRQKYKAGLLGRLKAKRHELWRSVLLVTARTTPYCLHRPRTPGHWLVRSDKRFQLLGQAGLQGHNAVGFH